MRRADATADDIFDDEASRSCCGQVFIKKDSFENPSIHVDVCKAAVAVVKLGPPNVRSSSRSGRSGYLGERYLEFSTPLRSRKPLVTTSRLARTA